MATVVSDGLHLAMRARFPTGIPVVSDAVSDGGVLAYRTLFVENMETPDYSGFSLFSRTPCQEAKAFL